MTSLDTTSDTRPDGLSIRDAARTISHVAAKHGLALEVTAQLGHLRGAGARAACDAAAAVLRLHGFAVAIDEQHGGAVIDVDPTACPAGATATEREQLANRLAKHAGDEAAAAWRAAVDRAERVFGRDAGEASEHATDEEYRWCMQQTLPFLRHRAVA